MIHVLFSLGYLAVAVVAGWAAFCWGLGRGSQAICAIISVGSVVASVVLAGSGVDPGHRQVAQDNLPDCPKGEILTVDAAKSEMWCQEPKAPQPVQLANGRHSS